MYQFGLTVTHACLVAQSLHIAIETKSWVSFLNIVHNIYIYFFLLNRLALLCSWMALAKPSHSHLFPLQMHSLIDQNYTYTPSFCLFTLHEAFSIHRHAAHTFTFFQSSFDICIPAQYNISPNFPITNCLHSEIHIHSKNSTQVVCNSLVTLLL